MVIELVMRLLNCCMVTELTKKKIVTCDTTFTGADLGFFLGGGALVSCSTSTPINHIVFFLFCRIPVVLENRRSSRGGGGGGGGGEGVRTPCTLPLDPPLVYSARKMVETAAKLKKFSKIMRIFFYFNKHVSMVHS